MRLTEVDEATIYLRDCDFKQRVMVLSDRWGNWWLKVLGGRLITPFEFRSFWTMGLSDLLKVRYGRSVRHLISQRNPLFQKIKGA
jgi:hypothetical protein